MYYCLWSLIIFVLVCVCAGVYVCITDGKHMDYEDQD